MFTKTLLTLVLLSFATAVAAAETIYNSTQPLAASQTISLQELWRVGSDEDVFFGEVAAVIGDKKGRVYVLDSRQSQVFAFDSTGQLMQTLSREGDGPGEVRHAADIFFTADTNMAIVRSFPAEFIYLDQAGTPAGQTRIPALGTKGEGTYFLSDATRTGADSSEDIVLSGGSDLMGGTQPEQVRFIARFTSGANEVTRYHEDRMVRGHNSALVERNNYFPYGDLHCVGSDGKVYLAPDRNSYRIEVYAPGGESFMTIERDFQSRKRGKLERDLVEAGYGGHANRHGGDAQFKVEATAPDIEALHITADGLLWVQHSRSYVDQPAGVMLTYDVFGPDGRLLRQVSIKCDGDARRDRLVPLSDGRWVRIAGAIDAAYARMGGGLNLAEAGDYPLEVICYQEK